MYIGVMMLTFFLVFFTAAVITYVMPKKFESKAVIHIMPSRSPIKSQNFTANELEVLRSSLILKQVSKQLDLSSRWEMIEDDAIINLRKMVEVSALRGTDLIEITVENTDKEVARDIAAEVYRAYKELRVAKEREILQSMVTELEKAIKDHTVTIEGADLEAQIALLEPMREKLALERVNLEASANLVELIEEPIMAQAPSSPNVGLNLLLGAVSGLIIGLSIALLMRWFLVRRKPCAV
jgi:uncharacterized protein involved in exopolysaccharide biosynthesis